MRVRLEPVRAIDEAQPRFVEQIFRDIAAARQARKEVEQARVELGVDGVERIGIAGTDAPHEIELNLPSLPRRLVPRSLGEGGSLWRRWVHTPHNA